MFNPYPLQIKGQLFELLTAKAIWWPSVSTLIVSDIHLGKSTHFNRNGLAIPGDPGRKDLEKLLQVSQLLNAQRILILGDLFHSEYNLEFELLKWFTEAASPAHTEVILGNHDILKDHFYEEAGLTHHRQPVEYSGMLFAHDFESAVDVAKGRYIFSGHVHPGVLIEGKARQTLRLPCFYFNNIFCILPAFGSLTGLYTINHNEETDRIFAVTGESVIEIPSRIKTSVKAVR